MLRIHINNRIQEIILFTQPFSAEPYSPHNSLMVLEEISLGTMNIPVQKITPKESRKRHINIQQFLIT